MNLGEVALLPFSNLAGSAQQLGYIGHRRYCLDTLPCRLRLKKSGIEPAPALHLRKANARAMPQSIRKPMRLMISWMWWLALLPKAYCSQA